jgi:hypothetical protein
MKAISLIICIAISFFLIGNAAAETYFVGQNAKGSGDGTSISNLMSVSTHNSYSFEPGDTINLIGTIKSTIKPPSSGAKGQYITYDGLYSGNASTPWNGLAVLNGGNEEKSNFAGIKIVAKSYLIVQDLEICYFREGIMIYGINSVGSDNIIIRRNFIHNIGSRGVVCMPSSTYKSRNTNITIGGSKQDGNELKNIGMGTDGYDINFGAVDGGIASYNHCWANGGNDGVWGTSDDRGISGISWGFNPTNLLIEHNKVHAHNDNYYSGPEYNLKGKGEHGIGGKGGTNVVVRYNHVFDHLIGQGQAVVMYGNWSNYRVYGNKIENNLLGIYTNDSSVCKEDVPEGMCDDGVNPGPGYIYSNVIVKTKTYSGILVGDPYCFTDSSRSPDKITSLYIYNNTIAYCATDPAASTETGIHLRARYGKIYIKNNILYKNRPNSSDNVQVWVGDASDVTMDYNHYYWPNTLSKTRWDGKIYNSIELPNQESSGTEGDPGLIDPENHNFKIQGDSLCVDSAADLGDMYDIGLSTITNWEDNPPDVKNLTHSEFNEWDKGAYVFKSHLSAPLLKIVGRN